MPCPCYYARGPERKMPPGAMGVTVRCRPFERSNSRQPSDVLTTDLASRAPPVHPALREVPVLFAHVFLPYGTPSDRVFAAVLADGAVNDIDAVR